LTEYISQLICWKFVYVSVMHNALEPMFELHYTYTNIHLSRDLMILCVQVLATPSFANISQQRAFPRSGAACSVIDQPSSPYQRRSRLIAYTLLMLRRKPSGNSKWLYMQCAFTPGPAVEATFLFKEGCPA
jgi:hypothetical protein